MPTLLAQIAPQRSTQYAALASALAPVELQLSPLSPIIEQLEPLELGGQAYLKLDLSVAPTAEQQNSLGRLAFTTAFFVYRDDLPQLPGVWLQALDPGFRPAFSPDLIHTRRYRGKTNELFTQFMCNLAHFSSDFAGQAWSNLRLLDPLMGGGTMLFTGLVLGGDVAGVDHVEQDVKSTASYLRQFMREQRIACQEQVSRLKRTGTRWHYTLGRQRRGRRTPQCVLALGDTIDTPLLTGGFKPHLIVTDLPYGVQHQGTLVELLTRALPVWASSLLRGGTMVLAWDATRFERAEMIALVQSLVDLPVLDAPLYNRLAHRVDRVIKRRDILVLKHV